LPSKHMAPERRTDGTVVRPSVAVQVGVAGQLWLGAEAAMAAAAKRALVYRMRGDRPVVGEGATANG
jgi:hypothetical protein